MEHNDTGMPICPYCGHEEEDCWIRGAWDFKSGIFYDFDCEKCGKTYLLAVVETVTFNTKPKEQAPLVTIYLPAWPDHTDVDAQHFFAEHLELETDCRVVVIADHYAITFVGPEHEQAIRVLYEQMPDYFASEVTA